MDNLSNLRICIEKPLPDELHIMEKLHDQANSKDHLKMLRASFLTAKLWPKQSVITVSFVDPSSFSVTAPWTPIPVLKGQRNLDGSQVQIDPIEYEIRNLTPVEAVKKVVRDRIAPITDLKFKFLRPGEQGHVRIGFDAHKGSNSLVGTDCIKSTEPVTLNLGWLDAGTIMHEFGHVLGLIHEHMNPRGKQISWDDAAVYQWAKQTQGWDHQTTYNNIIQRYSVDQTNGSDFDPKSIMLYFFPSKLTTDNKGTNANHRLSKIDVEYINKIYPNSDLSPSQFYKMAYGTPIKAGEVSGDGNNSGDVWKSVAITIGIILGILILLFLIFKVYQYLKNIKPNYLEMEIPELHTPIFVEKKPKVSKVSIPKMPIIKSKPISDSVYNPSQY